MRKWIIIGLIAGVTPTMACGGTTGNNDTTPNNGGENNVAANSTSNGETAETTTVRGRLTAEASGEAGVESKTVTASRLDENGETQPTEAEAETDAEGRYELVLEQSLEAGETLVIDANDGEELLGRVTLKTDAEASSDGEVNAPPITVESTAETNVMISARVEGHACAQCTVADVEQRIGSEVAAALETAAEAESNVYAEFSASVHAGIDAHAEMLLDESVGATEEQLQAAQDASVEAFAQLQSDLAASTSDEEVDEAHRAYAEAYLQAFLDSGITMEQLATASHAEAAARNSADVMTDADARATILADVESERAMRVRAVVEATFEAQSEANAQVESAGDELESSIEAAADAGAEAQAQIDDAWAQYSATVRSEIEAQLDAGQQTALGTLDSTLDSVTQVYAEAIVALDATADVTATATDSVDAVSELHGAIVTDANVDALVAAGLSAEAAEAYLEVIFHLRATSGVSTS